MGTNSASKLVVLRLVRGYNPRSLALTTRPTLRSARLPHSNLGIPLGAVALPAGVLPRTSSISRHGPAPPHAHTLRVVF